MRPFSLTRYCRTSLRVLLISETSHIHVVLSSFSVSQVRISAFCTGLDPLPTKHNVPLGFVLAVEPDNLIHYMRSRWRQGIGGNVKHSNDGYEVVVDDFMNIP